MSESPEVHPGPREIWRAALKGRRISMTVEPDARSVRSDGSIDITGDIVGREKNGNESVCYVTIRMVPDGELAPVEIEAAKERGTWTKFRVFHWEQSKSPYDPGEYAYEYIGQLTDVEIPGVRWVESASRTKLRV